MSATSRWEQIPFLDEHYLGDYRGIKTAMDGLATHQQIIPTVSCPENDSSNGFSELDRGKGLQIIGGAVYIQKLYTTGNSPWLYVNNWLEK